MKLAVRQLPQMKTVAQKTYGDTEEERNVVEDVETEESDSPKFKVAKKDQAAL